MDFDVYCRPIKPLQVFFIINCDIKYYMGKELGGEDDK